jgi:hypothetical protein
MVKSSTSTSVENLSCPSHSRFYVSPPLSLSSGVLGVVGVIKTSVAPLQFGKYISLSLSLSFFSCLLHFSVSVSFSLFSVLIYLFAAFV